MVELTKKLEEAGLSSKEALVYISLLKNSPISGGNLAKLLNMDRTHTYNILRNLINKGLAGHIVKEKTTLFQATSPKNLLNEIKKKEQTIQDVLPNLLKIEKTKAKPSVVRILEGKSGLRTIIRMLLESKTKEILVFGGTGKSYDVLKYEMSHVAKKTILLGMKGRIITSERLKGHTFTRLKNFELRYVKELTPTSTMIFRDIVSINVFDENPFVIVIESRSVSDSYKKYFHYLWKIAKE